jgi:hypothetical protein
MCLQTWFEVDQKGRKQKKHDTGQLFISLDVKVKVKLSLCLTKHHAMKTYLGSVKSNTTLYVIHNSMKKLLPLIHNLQKMQKGIDVVFHDPSLTESH